MSRPRQKKLRVGSSVYLVVYGRIGNSYIPSFILVSGSEYDIIYPSFSINIGNDSYTLTYINFKGSYIPSYTPRKYIQNTNKKYIVDIGPYTYYITHIVFRKIKFNTYINIHADKKNTIHDINIDAPNLTVKITYNDDGYPAYSKDNKSIGITSPSPPIIKPLQNQPSMPISKPTYTHLLPPPVIATSSNESNTQSIPSTSTKTNPIIPKSTLWYYMENGRWVGYSTKNNGILTNAYNVNEDRTTIAGDYGIQYTVELNPPYVQYPIGTQDTSQVSYLYKGRHVKT